MIRLIKRYGGGSRKLYDTEESRYVSLEEIGAWVRGGQEVQVVDSASGEDVTAATLAQSLYEDQKRGASVLSAGFLHELIRKGGRALADTVGHAQARLDTLVQSSVGNLQDEMSVLRLRLQELEASLADLEQAAPEAASHVRRGTRISAARNIPKRRPRA